MKRIESGLKADRKPDRKPHFPRLLLEEAEPRESVRAKVVVSLVVLRKLAEKDCVMWLEDCSKPDRNPVHDPFQT